MGYHRDEEYDSDMMESEEGFSDDGFGDVSDDNGSSWKVRPFLVLDCTIWKNGLTSLYTHIYIGAT